MKIWMLRKKFCLSFDLFLEQLWINWVFTDTVVVEWY